MDRPGGHRELPRTVGRIGNQAGDEPPGVGAGRVAQTRHRIGVQSREFAQPEQLQRRKAARRSLRSRIERDRDFALSRDLHHVPDRSPADRDPRQAFVDRREHGTPRVVGNLRDARVRACRVLDQRDRGVRRLDERVLHALPKSSVAKLADDLALAIPKSFQEDSLRACARPEHEQHRLLLDRDRLDIPIGRHSRLRPELQREPVVLELELRGHGRWGRSRGPGKEPSGALKRDRIG